MIGIVIDEYRSLPAAAALAGRATAIDVRSLLTAFGPVSSPISIHPTEFVVSQSAARLDWRDTEL